MQLKNNPIVFLTQKLWHYSKGNRGNVVLYFILFIIANSIYFLEPFVVAKTLNTIQAQGVHKENFLFLVFLLGLLIVLQIGFWIFHGPARVIETKNAFLIRANYKKYLLEGTLALSPTWHTDHHSGDTIDKIEKGTHALYEYAEHTFQVIGGFMSLIMSFLALAYFDLNATAIVLFMVIVTVNVILRFDRILIEQYHQLNRIENSISAKIFDVISNVTTVIILRIEKLVSKSITKKIFQPFPLAVRNSKINETKWGLVAICGSIMVFLVLLSYLFNTLRSGGTVMIGVIYLLYSYLHRVMETFFNFAYQYGDIVRQKTAVLNAEEIANQFQNKKEASPFDLHPSWKEIRIDNLFFSYHTEEGADLHLHDVSIALKKGERIALIGESGSGKTTLLKILRGLYTPQKVRVSLDGKTIQNGLHVLSPHMALIPQDPEIFSTTIKENITVGVEHKLPVIKKYTDMARFSDVVERLPKKLESSIVEKGVNLSGGEKQRLALARGLMACADKSIVLLDEPTSSVDLKNELSIYQNIFRSFKDKTILSSIHRLHLLHLFDTIYFFDGGRVIASGSLDHLLQTSKEFQTMWQKYQETKNMESDGNS